MSSIPRPHRNCRAAGCSTNRYREGLCRAHYHQRYQERDRTGDTRARWVKRAAGEDNPYANAEHRAWRKAILERDGHRCQLCPHSPPDGKGLHAHHIDHNPRHRSLANGVTLCRKCHNGIEREYRQGRPGPMHRRLALVVPPPEGGFFPCTQ